MTLLSVERLVIRYGSVQAVHGVSLSAEVAHVVGILGANGAGKSSLLRGIAGLVRPASGRVVYQGTDVRRRSVQKRARLGMVLTPEGRGLLGGMSVEDNMRLGAYAGGRVSPHQMRERFAEATDLFPVLGSRRHQLASSLSGGEASMLAIARALMSKPELLMLDEPTLGLAPLAAQALFERLLVLKQSGQAMIIVEQRAVGLLDVADRILVMSRGEVIRDVSATDVDIADLQADYFGRRPIADASPTALAAANPI